MNNSGIDSDPEMANFNPLLFFCDNHHDKLIDGANTFGPMAFGKKCRAFLWSKTFASGYRVPLPTAINDIDEKLLTDEPPTNNYVDLTRTNQRCGEYILYVLW